MYISKIKICQFRNFKEKEIEFNDGMNVIIGHNNAGKTNLIKVLSLVIDNQKSKKLEVDDFNKNLTLVELQTGPPKISIAVTIKNGLEEDPDDLVTVSNWLTILDSNYEALLTYEFYLPDKKKSEYLEEMSSISATDPNSMDRAWKIIRHNYIRFYVFKIWGGNPVNQSIADSESLQKFDFQFLDAIRDVERDMLTGKNMLLRDVFEFFMDYEIKIDPSKEVDQKRQEIKSKKTSFSEKSDALILDLSDRIRAGKKEILSYAKNTGASFNRATPNFEGSISENEMYSVLKLIVEYEAGIKIPASHNGLGYNNLIYMSLLLAKMQVNADVSYLDTNAKVFTILAIEEPEAHLHPAMQYKFLKFLNENKKEKKVRQVFVTTHSTHITSAVSLDEIICLHNEGGETNVGYPKKVFINPDGSENTKSKKYVQRFLDATKSDMLFAQKVIFVEGIAEYLLMSIFANYLGKSLEDQHVTVINVGGRYFNHFLYLFDSLRSNTIPKKIICITDRDHESKEKTGTCFTKCYPYEFNQDATSFDYQTNPNADLYPISSHPNITFYSQPILQSNTFEYEILLHNPNLEILITNSIKNSKEIRDLMQLYNTPSKTVEDLLHRLSISSSNKKIVDGIKLNTTLTDDEKKKAIIASRYLNSVGKGENALELCYALQENLDNKGTPDFKNFTVPPYIKDAIEKICQ